MPPRKAAPQQESEVVRALQDIALGGAADAMQLMVDLVRGDAKDISRDRITAAQFILDHVAGRPGPKNTPSSTDKQILDLIADVRAIRSGNVGNHDGSHDEHHDGSLRNSSEDRDALVPQTNALGDAPPSS